MTIDRVVLAFAGTMILVSLLLSRFHSAYWLWFTAFVGVNPLQSSFTGFCPLVKILKPLGIKPGQAFETSTNMLLVKSSPTSPITSRSISCLGAS